MNGDDLAPSSPPLSVPAGIPEPELSVWLEVRTCLGAGALTAAVMLCRKLLLHLAVTEGLPPKDSRERAPSYQEAVDYLVSAGLITARMKPWVDRIKAVGNEVNHEIKAVDADTAIDVAQFTEQLLRLTYEMDTLMAQPGSRTER